MEPKIAVVDNDAVDCSCGEKLPLKPCKSAAGWYLGYVCPNCGPYDRVSVYVATKEDAARLLGQANS